MWYGSTKVGILEIDSDHANIDTMLQLYFSGVVDESYLEEIILGLGRHFEHEVNVVEELGGIFPQRHLEEHQRVNGYLSQALARVKAGELDGRALADEVSGLLLLHVVDFDLELADCIP